MKTIKIPHVENLYFAELGKQIDFEIKRVFFVANFTGHRGGHANLKVQEYVFVTKGAVRFTLEKDGKKETIVLDTIDTGLFIGEKTWIDIESVEDESTYVVLANSIYNRADYVNTYEEFKKL